MQFEYNFLNLLSRVTDGAGKVANYTWGTDGLKRKVSVAGDPLSELYYLGSYVYKTYGGTAYYLESVAFPEGRFVKATSGYDVHYHVKDHLGSVRATVNANGVVANKSDYYPFGDRWSSSGEATTNRYLFSGKEKQTAGDLRNMNLLDFGARMYDPEIPRWLTNDPLAEKYFTQSPYVYCLNNPVKNIDPDGRLVIFINGMHAGSGGKSEYWKGIDDIISKNLKDRTVMYRDGSLGGALGLGAQFFITLDPDVRANRGFMQGYKDVGEIFKLITDKNGNIKETIKIITHSMGGAYGKGYVDAIRLYCIENNIDPRIIEFEVDIAPFQPKDQNIVKGVKIFQFSHSNDKVAGNERMKGAEYMDASMDKDQSHGIATFKESVSTLKAGNYRVVNGKIT